MRCWTDLHIHSCLSPCADEDMTPNNIVNMALLKGLDIIAITDHNSVKNAGYIMEAGEKAGLIVIPGMELCTSEEIHLVCLFSKLDDAILFEKEVYQNLSPMKNNEKIFGSQIIMDTEDCEVGREDRLLIGACNMDAGTAIMMVRQLNGIVIPAHINRDSFSMLNTLGTIPEEYGFKYLECSKSCDREELLRRHQDLCSYAFITSSDAHYLADILECEVSFELPEKSVDMLLNSLR